MSSEVRLESTEDASVYLASLRASGAANIAGLDECGRGPYAGPVVAACVLLPVGHGITGIRDSKRLSASRREALAEEIKEKAVWGIGSRTHSDIDRLNIRVATHQAAAEAALSCMYTGAPIDHLLCDGGLFLDALVPFSTSSVIKGDFWFESISAASIVAKVYRDHKMAEYHEVWPEYGFNTNQGYGTKVHREAILKYGMTSIHRRSYGLCKTAKEREDGT